MDVERDAWTRRDLPAGGGALLAVFARGAGPPLVILPGGPGGYGWLYRHLLAPLAITHTLVSHDARGCGESTPGDSLSMADDLADLGVVLEDLGTPAVLLGHSYGGMLALQVAAVEPARVRGLVLVATFERYGSLVEGGRRARAGLSAEDAAAEASLLGKLMRGCATPAEHAAYRARTAGRSLHAPVDPALVALQDVAYPVRLAVQSDIYTYDVREALPGLEIPALVIAGRHDPLCGEAPRRLAEALPRARFLELEGCGHHPLLEETATVLGHVTGWLADLP